MNALAHSLSAFMPVYSSQDSLIPLMAHIGAALRELFTDCEYCCGYVFLPAHEIRQATKQVRRLSRDRACERLLDPLALL